jgi:hypothetical protein
MEEPEKRRPIISGGNWVIVGLAVCGLFLVEKPFEALRPHEGSLPATDNQESYRYLRLWQDPFEPFRVEKPEGTSSSTLKPASIISSQRPINPGADEVARDIPSPDSMSDVARELSIALKGGPTLVVPVLLPGGPYTEEGETRGRYRYAIVSALFAGGFQPMAYRQIRYYKLRTSSIPYEWFCNPDCPELSEQKRLRSDDTAQAASDESSGNPVPVVAGKRKSVLVIWLDEDELVRTLDPHAALKALLPFATRITAENRFEPNIDQVSDRALPHLAIIGPATSAVLLRWAKTRPALGATPASPEDATWALVNTMDSYLDKGIPLTAVRGTGWMQWHECVRDAFEKSVPKKVDVATPSSSLDNATRLWRLEESLSTCTRDYLADKQDPVASITDGDDEWWNSVTSNWLGRYGYEWFKAHGYPFAPPEQLLLVTMSLGQAFGMQPSTWSSVALNSDSAPKAPLPKTISDLIKCAQDARNDAAGLAKCLKPLPTSKDFPQVITDARGWLVSAHLRMLGVAPSAAELTGDFALADESPVASKVLTMNSRERRYLEFQEEDEDWGWLRSNLADRLASSAGSKSSSQKFSEIASRCIRSATAKQTHEIRVLDDNTSSCLHDDPTIDDGLIQEYELRVSYFMGVRRALSQLTSGCESSRKSLDALIACASVFDTRATSYHELPRSFMRPELAISEYDNKTPPFWFWPQLQPTIPSDDQLAAVLVRELRNRRVDLCESGPSDRVVLVGELDTFYGKTFREAFENAVRDCRPSRYPFNGRLTGVLTYGYLQGLDGAAPSVKDRSIPDSQPISAADAGPSNNSILAALKSTIEYPVGAPQLDYVRRLADRIARENGKDVSESVAPSESRIKAIGVIGTDVYDKAIALQALRNRFPEAILFTTDLDARLFHPKELPWTRGLVVATGLSLDPPLPQSETAATLEVPSFRDVYQTSAFIATTAALTEAFEAGGHGRMPDNGPLLFEIGARGPVALGLPTIGSSTSNGPGKEGADITRTRVGNYQTLRVAVFSVLLSALLFSVFNILPGVLAVFSDRSDTLFRIHFLWACVLSLLMLGLLWWVLQMDAQSANGEPFRWFEGISAWPSELVRWLDGALGLIALAFMLYSFRKCRSTIESFLHMGEQARNSSMSRVKAAVLDVLARRRSLADTLAQLWKSLSLVYWLHRLEVYEQTRVKPIDWRRLWAVHNSLDRASFRVMRALVLMAQLCLVYWILVKVTGDSDPLPARGTIIVYANRVMEVWSIGIATLVTFIVVDATRLATALTDCMGTVSVKWHSDCVRQQAEDLGVDEQSTGEWVGIQVIGEYTGAIGWMIMIPTTLLFLLVAARSSYLDSWGWPLPVVTCTGVLGLYVVAKAIILRRGAERARAGAIRRLQETASRLAVAGSRARVEQIEMLVKRVQKYDEGAFSPWSKNPVLRALLLPVGGFGALELLNLLTIF